MSDDCGPIFKGLRILWHAFVGADSGSSGPSMYGAETVRPTDERTNSPASRRLEATRRRPARLILNIDHVYSTQRDSLVITISTTGQHGPLASSIVPDRLGPAFHGPSPFRLVPSDWSSCLVASWWSCGRLTLYHCAARCLVCNFIKWVSLVRSSATTRRIRWVVEINRRRAASASSLSAGLHPTAAIVSLV